jgi:hypothetical protein
MRVMNRLGRVKQGDLSQAAEIVALCTIFIFIAAIVLELI